MNKIVLSAPNISEGRDLDLVEEVVDEIRKVEGVKIIDYSSDADHNRSVLTYLGEAGLVLEATKAMAAKAIELIDMRTHEGSHPRMGAVDVVPFIPIRGIENDEAVALAKEFGEYLGGLGVPVY
ncbi:MAG: glutamate formiminotransferase, partial [Anaerolineales bacterium]|nr:glutamate formiminotransferase [Anaerolineales bacterium]